MRDLRVHRFTGLVALLALAAGSALAQDAAIKVDVSSARSIADVHRSTDAAVRQFTKNIAELTRRAQANGHLRYAP